MSHRVEAKQILLLYQSVCESDLVISPGNVNGAYHEDS